MKRFPTSQDLGLPNQSFNLQGVRKKKKIYEREGKRAAAEFLEMRKFNVIIQSHCLRQQWSLISRAMLGTKFFFQLWPQFVIWRVMNSGRVDPSFDLHHSQLVITHLTSCGNNCGIFVSLVFFLISLLNLSNKIIIIKSKK